MRLLLDTQALLWFLNGSERLQEAARNLILEEDNEVLVSAASLWEIAIKASVGKLELRRPFRELFPDQLSSNGIDVLPIMPEHLSGLVNLPFHHRDPFDRLIIAQAISEHLPIVTSDPTFQQYPVEVIGT